MDDDIKDDPTMMWKCKICGELFECKDNGNALLKHFDMVHSDKDICDVVDNYIEQVDAEPLTRRINLAIVGICLALTKQFGIPVIERDGRYYQTNLKGLEEEITMENILE